MPGHGLRRWLLWCLVIAVLLAAASGIVVRIGGRADRRAAMAPPHAKRAASPELSGDTKLAPLTLSSPAVSKLRLAVKGANVVICVIDAARADHVGCYGYARDTTPSIDRLAGESILFEQHFCQFPHTFPSTGSLFTSQYLDTHLAYGTRALPPSTFTMAQGLRAAGFHTAAFSSNAWVSAATSLGRYFERSYLRAASMARAPLRAGPARASARTESPVTHDPESILRLASEWLADQPTSPFFAYLHFVPPTCHTMLPRI